MSISSAPVLAATGNQSIWSTAITPITEATTPIRIIFPIGWRSPSILGSA